MERILIVLIVVFAVACVATMAFLQYSGWAEQLVCMHERPNDFRACVQELKDRTK